MKRMILFSVIAWLVSLPLLMLPVTCFAEEVEYKVTSYIVRSEYIMVPDVDKHAIGCYERRGIALMNNGETAAYHTRGTYDFTDYNGPFQGYSSLTYPDGSTILMKYSGNMVKKAQGKLPTYSGKGEYIKGTGKYEGIQGNTDFEAEYVTPNNKETKGDVVANIRGSYSLPK